jgi:hypothetical protein
VASYRAAVTPRGATRHRRPARGHEEDWGCPLRLAAPLLLAALLTGSAENASAGRAFSAGRATAHRFGTHEIVLTGSGGVPNPFDTVATVTFEPPSGPAGAKTVLAFYDGGDTWRARVYVTETGRWRWTSSCAADPALDGRSGRFRAKGSKLRGLLRLHPANPRAWVTDDGRWFADLSDTGYRLLHALEAPLWKEFLRDSAARGTTSMRAAALGGWGGLPAGVPDSNNHWGWNDPWEGGATPDTSRFDLAKFQTTDARLIWSLDHHPELYFQLILFGLKGYGSDGTGEWWFSLPEAVRTRTLRYLIARWSAFPHVFWLIANDMHLDESFPGNRAFVREVGRFFAANEPWRHLMSTGPNRLAGFPFAGPEDRDWCSYVHIEDADGVGATQIEKYGFDGVPLHVFLGEDFYEQDYGHYRDPRFFFRWLLWSWTLAGGSANYCGRWGPIHPYGQTSRPDLAWTGAGGDDYTGEPLRGLDSIRYVAPYFRKRGIDLGLFAPDPALATDLAGRGERLRPIATRRGSEEILVYHPNALASGAEAQLDPATAAGVRLDLTAFANRYEVSWFRPFDGAKRSGGEVEGGAPAELVAPWTGCDVVLRLVRKPAS